MGGRAKSLHFCSGSVDASGVTGKARTSPFNIMRWLKWTGNKNRSWGVCKGSYKELEDRKMEDIEGGDLKKKES